MLALMCVVLIEIFAGYGSRNTADTSLAADYSMDAGYSSNGGVTNVPHIPGDTAVLDVINNPLFGGFGKFIFPIGRGLPDSGMKLSNIGSLLPYHNNIDTDTTVRVINYMLDEVSKGHTIFYDIYSDGEKQADPSKEDTGLFFFRGVPDAPFAIVSAGGGFSYVGSIHESFPMTLELSQKGYNAFSIQYRTGGADVACEDLAAAISFVFANAESLGVNTNGYSLWGGSAGARMAAYLGSYGAAAYGGNDVPKPDTIVMQYTGHSDYTANDPPTFVCIGENDGIASPQIMERRVNALKALGIDTEFHIYPHLGHGFGLGIGTSAEGWFEEAVAFWEKHMPETALTPTKKPLEQITYLWEKGNTPSTTVYTENKGNYADPPNFRPYMVYFPAKGDTAVKGAILICAGGAFTVRSDFNEGTPVAEAFAELGYQAFVVNYRLRPYTQEEGALDLARAVRYVRSYAEQLGIDENDIAVLGFSAGGILCGEMLLNYDGLVDGTSLDPEYVPDELDKVSVDAADDGMIYSFYGRLSVASTDVEKFRVSGLPPTYFLYGTRDPFVREFEECVAALKEAGVTVESHSLEGWPHGFGAADGKWIKEFDKWLHPIFETN
ncbi:MAG: alpha/beta hydrolase [Flexilinea sp.]